MQAEDSFLDSGPNLDNLISRIDQRICVFAIENLNKEKKKIALDDLANICLNDNSYFASFSQPDKGPHSTENAFEMVGMLTILLKAAGEHELNKVNLINYTNQSLLKYLVNRYMANEQAIALLYLLVKATSITDELTILGSNAIHLLHVMDQNFIGVDFSGIQLRNTELIGCNFSRSNLQDSVFESVNISGCNFFSANLSNVKWSKIQCVDQAFIQCQAGQKLALIINPEQNTSPRSSLSRTKVIFNSYQHSIHLAIFRPQYSKVQKSTKLYQSRGLVVNQKTKIFATGSQMCRVTVGDLISGKTMRIFKFPLPNDYIEGIAISSDGKVLILNTNLGQVALLEVSSGKILKHFIAAVNFNFTRVQLNRSHTITQIGYELCKRISPSRIDAHYRICKANRFYHERLDYTVGNGGKLVAVGQYTNTIKIFGSKCTKLIRKFRGHRDDVLSVAFSSGGQILASGGQDGTIILWDIQKGSIIAAFSAQRSSVRSLAFTPGDHYLISAQDGSIRLWDLENVEKLRKGISFWQYHQVKAIRNVKFYWSQDDAYLYLWNEIEILKQIEMTKKVQYVIFSWNRQLLGIGCDDFQILIWNFTLNRVINRLQFASIAEVEQFLQTFRATRSFFKKMVQKKDQVHRQAIGCIYTDTVVASSAIDANKAIIDGAQIVSNKSFDLVPVFKKWGARYNQNLQSAKL